MAMFRRWRDRRDTQRNERQSGGLLQRSAPYVIGAGLGEPSSNSNSTAPYDTPPGSDRQFYQPSLENDHIQAAAQRLREASRQAELAEHDRARIVRERAQANAAKSATLGRIRELRAYIREKHRLDVAIWQEGTRPYAEKEGVVEMCQRSDELMKWICETVERWEEDQFKKPWNEYGSSAVARSELDRTALGEWKMAKMIKEELTKVKDTTTPWMQKLPWHYAIKVVHDDD